MSCQAAARLLEARSGANTDKKGYLEQADGGTLFLDVLREISLMGQVKLLR